LAASEAEAGHFDQAVATARQARQLAMVENDGAVVNELQAQINLYLANAAFHENGSP
jgi:hypothetical protein